MMTAMDVDKCGCDPCSLDSAEQWRITLSLDLEERSVLEAEVLLWRIIEQNLPADRTTQ